MYDQTQLLVLHKGTKLMVPDSIWDASIRKKLKETFIDVKIPESHCKFSIRQKNSEVCGKSRAICKSKNSHLQGINSSHLQVNRVTLIPKQVKYYKTRRVDGKYTLMPIIPWIESSINGIRYDAMIHLVTNPETLEKA